MIVAVELTVPWKERCYDAYRKKNKYAELIITSREKGLKCDLSKSTKAAEEFLDYQYGGCYMQLE